MGEEKEERTQSHFNLIEARTKDTVTTTVGTRSNTYSEVGSEAQGQLLGAPCRGRKGRQESTSDKSSVQPFRSGGCLHWFLCDER